MLNSNREQNQLKGSFQEFQYQLLILYRLRNTAFVTNIPRPVIGSNQNFMSTCVGVEENEINILAF